MSSASPTRPRSTSVARTSVATSRICDHPTPGTGSRSTRSSSGWSRSSARTGVRVQLEAREVGHPHQGGGVTRHHFLSLSPRRKLERDDFDPWRPGFRRTLLVEVLAADAVGVAHQHIRPMAGAAERALRYREVVLRQVQLRVACLREEHLARVRDRDLPSGHTQEFLFASHWHALTKAT